MKILIIGLGVIGGSYAMGLSKNHTVYGVDTNQKTIDDAKRLGYIVDGDTTPERFLPDCEFVVLAIYPSMILPFIKNHQFKPHTIITDVAGVKESFIYSISECLPNDVEFIGSHPMAGKEKRGFDYADNKVFQGANFLITPCNNSEYAISVLKSIATELGFKRITVMTPHYHDQMIAFTSQLTHAIAVSLVNSDNDPNTPYYTGDSYRDLTRIAQINEDLWSELFLENKANLLEKIETFEDSLNDVKEALIHNDQERLKELFISSTKKRVVFNEKN